MAGDPKMDELSKLFEAGDYGAVRKGVAVILASDASDDTKQAARELRSRTEPSRFQLVLLVLAAVFVVALSTYEIVMHSASRSTH